jgi:hypothetical protein
MHQIDEAIEDMMIMYNWPPQPQMGYGITLIYYAVLKDNAKVRSEEVGPNKYRIIFENTKRPAGIKQTTLTPRPE